MRTFDSYTKSQQLHNLSVVVDVGVLFVLTRRADMMFNYKQQFVFYFWAIVHSVITIFSLFMTKEGLKRKGIVGAA